MFEAIDWSQPWSKEAAYREALKKAGERRMREDLADDTAARLTNQGVGLAVGNAVRALPVTDPEDP
jgi:hypothetical protein